MIGWRCQVRQGELQGCKGVMSQRALTKRNLTSPQERCFLRLDVETIDQLLTLEVLCPRRRVDYATSVPTEKVNYRMNLESVLGESLQRYGVKRNVPFTHRTGGTMSVNFEVTDTKRALLSVRKGCGNGSMIVSTPDGRGQNHQCQEMYLNTCNRSWRQPQGFGIVYDRGAYVLDVDVNGGVYVNDGSRKFDRDSGINFFPSYAQSIGKEP